MRKLRIGVIDLVSKGPTKALYARVMNANLASIMPQVVAAWCEAEGHDVTHVCYTGFEDLVAELPADADLVFVGAFTEAAQTAYALSSLFRSRGAVTALVTLMQTDASYDVRIACTQALGTLGGAARSAVPNVTAMMKAPPYQAPPAGATTEQLENEMKDGDYKRALRDTLAKIR